MTTAATTAQAHAPVMRKVVAKHHWLVRVTHWLNVPILLGLGVSGLAIYWAAPLYHTANGTDEIAVAGGWIARHLPLPHDPTAPPPTDWVYNHLSFGTGELADALRLHWLFAYLFMANALLYAMGLVAGGGYRSLLPKRTDPVDALRMMRYYLGLIPAKLARKSWPHPLVESKYNALQRAAYFSMPVAGLLAIASGWAMHKPQQFGPLEHLFVGVDSSGHWHSGYDYARVWHFWLMWVFAAFVIPHVILAIADGWDTFRSMVVGWSDRISGEADV